MAYVAMNNVIQYLAKIEQFLNGVCRHEHFTYTRANVIDFLNGVCRHERVRLRVRIRITFLNGVCRHEPLITKKKN